LFVRIFKTKYYPSEDFSEIVVKRSLRWWEKNESVENQGSKRVILSVALLSLPNMETMCVNDLIELNGKD
jgi:hypothetical protein